MITRTFSLYRSSFSGLSPEIWLLSLVMLINRSGTMVIPFMTLYLTTEQMGYSLSQAGTVIGIFGAGSIIGAYFGGKLSDRVGFYYVQVFTLLTGGLMFIILGQVKSYPLICLCTFLLSIVNEAFRPANSSAIASYSNAANRTRSYSLNRLAINLGWAVGTSVGGFIASYNYELLFWVDGVTNICAALVMLFFVRPVQTLAVPHKTEVINKSASAYSDKTYLWFIFLITLFAICFFQLFTTIPKYFRDNLFLSETYIGMIMAVNGLLIVAIEMVLVYKLEGKRSNLIYISAGVFICALAFFSLLLPGDGKLISLGMILLISVGEVVGMPFMSSYWAGRANDSNRGQYAALFTISWGIAQTLGPTFCALLADHTSFPVLFVCLGMLLIITAGGFYRMHLKQAVAI
jgi:predicted MFS family arabinose efflux permease